MTKVRIIPLGLALIATLALSGCFFTAGPRADFSATPLFDYPPLHVTFDASASSSPNGAVVSYDWDFGDGGTGTGVTTTHTYTSKGVYAVTLLITDSDGKTGARTKTVEALNRVPTAKFEYWPYMVDTHTPMQFDASDSTDPDGEIVSYIWSFGDGVTDEGVRVEHQYTTAGGSGWQPTVTLTVTDDSGGSGSVSRQVHVVGCDSCG